MFEAKHKISQLIDAARSLDPRLNMAVREIADMVNVSDFPDDERDRLQRAGLEMDVKRAMKRAVKFVDGTIPEEIQPSLEGIPQFIAMSQDVGTKWLVTNQATRDEYITAMRLLDEKAVQTASKAESMRQLWKTIDYVWSDCPDRMLWEVLIEHAKREDAAHQSGFVPSRGTSDGLPDSPLA